MLPAGSHVHDFNRVSLLYYRLYITRKVDTQTLPEVYMFSAGEVGLVFV